MIRIVLLGRTGNHLFQYALGRVLAAKHQVPLILDASWFNPAGWAEVSHFLRLPLHARVARRFSIGTRALRRVTGRHYWEYLGIPVLKENPSDHSFDPSFLEAPDDCVIFGYFQTPLYFSSIADDYRSELRSLLSTAAPLPRDLRARISQPSSAAVHVRRADYLTHPELMVCDMDYYENAMNHLRGRVPGIRFFIFSDDPAWCGSHFRQDDQELVRSANPSGNPLTDLHLMSLTSHHIIANSTYSWWAAWLAKHPSQMVITPEMWNKGGPKVPLSEKLLPHWHPSSRRTTD